MFLFRKKVFCALLCLIVAFAGFYYWGNVHVLDPGVVYRSAQLHPSRLAQVIDGYGIRSVLNLRGQSESQWYQDEIKVCTEKNVKHISWKLSAMREVSSAEIDLILYELENMPKPVLIHCQGGADRTGLVSAAYLYGAGASAEDARKALSYLYGHLPWFGNRTIAMDLSFDRYVDQSP